MLWKSHGERLRALADRLTREAVQDGRRPGFGIVAGTGTGKTLSIKPIAQVMLATDDLRVPRANRQRFNNITVTADGTLQLDDPDAHESQRYYQILQAP